LIAMSELTARARKIELLVLDVDGVLTDGRIVYTADGVEIKQFHVRDGSGLKFWHALGKRSAIISGRTSPAVERRARELGIAPVFQGCAAKLPALETLIAETKVRPEQLCAIGDDLPDLPVLRRCGLAIAVADACAEVRALADFTTPSPGGHGAVRDAIEWLLKLQGLWDGVVAGFTGNRVAA
jgi:3-deoxy-D-manno-octulosonate 8-phosphate phosphatase (KDO 8-P phosphatase)